MWPGLRGANPQGSKREIFSFFFLTTPFLHIRKQNRAYNINEFTPLLPATIALPELSGFHVSQWTELSGGQ